VSLLLLYFLPPPRGEESDDFEEGEWRWPFIFFFVLFVRRENERVKKNERSFVVAFEKKNCKELVREFSVSNEKRNEILLLFVVSSSSSKIVV